MMDPKLIDDIANRLHDAMPSGMRALQDDLDKNLRGAIQATLKKLDLVTREEFDIQAQVLLRTREKLEAMTRRVEALEKETGIKPAVQKPDSESKASPSNDQDMDGG